jgi:hypothetical protein
MPSTGESEATLLEIVRAAWDKAERYGLHNEHDVLRLVGICYIFGSTFDADPARPWIGEVLGDPRMSEESKVRVLWARLRAEAK